MPTQDVSNRTSPDAHINSRAFGDISVNSTHLLEAERQAVIAAEAGRQIGFHLARHVVEAERCHAAQKANYLENIKNIESKRPLAHRFKQWCLNEMHISVSTGYKYVKLGKIKIFRVGNCTMISDEESRRILAEGVR